MDEIGVGFENSLIYPIWSEIQSKLASLTFKSSYGILVIRFTEFMVKFGLEQGVKGEESYFKIFLAIRDLIG